MSLAGKRVDASSGRREMLKIIEGFRKEGVRRRSYVFSSLVIRSGV
jgi:sentrin-specific protease 8